MEFTFYGHACFKIDTGKESRVFFKINKGKKHTACYCEKI